jgi:PIN domain
MTTQGHAEGSPDAVPEFRLIRAVLDANVIYPAFLRDVLLRLAASGLYQPRWTARIHDEWIRNVIRDRPDLSPAAFTRIRAATDAHFPGALVTGYEGLETRFGDVDAGDRHVAAAALRAGATRIITMNLKHFPAHVLQVHDIVPVHPDEFIVQLIRDDEATARGALERHRAGLQKPAHTVQEYATAFRRAGLIRSAVLLWS